MANKVKAKVPFPPTGSVYGFQLAQTGLGIGLALSLEACNAETRVSKALAFDGSPRALGLAVSVVALVAQFVMIPAMSAVIHARKTYGVGQPLHHLAPGELASEDDRLLWLFKLRAFENIVEWLPVFVAQAIAACLLGKPATTVLLCVPYTLGRVLYTYGYGSGVADSRIPGLVFADFFSLVVLRGILLIALARHFAGAGGTPA